MAVSLILTEQIIKLFIILLLGFACKIWIIEGIG